MPVRRQNWACKAIWGPLTGVGVRATLFLADRLGACCRPSDELKCYQRDEHAHQGRCCHVVLNRSRLWLPQRSCPSRSRTSSTLAQLAHRARAASLITVNPSRFDDAFITSAKRARRRSLSQAPAPSAPLPDPTQRSGRFWHWFGVRMQSPRGLQVQPRCEPSRDAPQCGAGRVISPLSGPRPLPTGSLLPAGKGLIRRIEPSG